ncbi:hypothetical protein ONZ51_g7605 [Trametes cubensis]|uniref:Uncharacterized protein n=1 Tax=Trametes cubensis TaxID=1111947 RepID=A0AAD7TR00_9APHY|nr:hypothetical protein ONZ51_g7605 [Trametes cubensis]
MDPPLPTSNSSPPPVASTMGPPRSTSITAASLPGPSQETTPPHSSAISKRTVLALAASLAGTASLAVVSLWLWWRRRKTQTRPLNVAQQGEHSPDGSDDRYYPNTHDEGGSAGTLENDEGRSVEETSNDFHIVETCTMENEQPIRSSSTVTTLGSSSLSQAVLINNELSDLTQADDPKETLQPLQPIPPREQPRPDHTVDAQQERSPGNITNNSPTPRYHDVHVGGVVSLPGSDLAYDEPPPPYDSEPR